MRYVGARARALELFLPLAILFSAPLALAKSDVHSGYRQFLMNLGFEDQSAEMRQSLAAKDFLDPEVSPKVLTYQAQRFEVYNDVREIAVDVLGTLHENNISAESRRKIIQLIVKLVTTKPLRPPTEFPARIASAPAAERDALKLQFAIEVTRDNIERQTEILMADIVGTMHGSEKTAKLVQQLEERGSQSVSEADRKEIADLKILQQRLKRVVRFMYLDEYMGSFSVTAIGKALILGLTRFEKTESQGQQDLIKEMKAALKSAGMHYENYVGTTLKVKNSKGGVEDVKIENGDFIAERSTSKEALDITSAPRPGGVRNYLRGMRLGLTASVIANLMVPSDEASEEKLGRFKRAMNSVRKAFGELRIVRQGVSHIGMAEVLKDEETGIETTRVIDNYPDANGGEGGIRVTDMMHEFAKESEFMRFMVTRFDPDLYYNYAHQFVFKNEYRETVYMAHTYDENGKVVKANNVPWKTTLTKDDWRYLYVNNSLSHKEFLKTSLELAVLEMHDLKRKGIAFGYGFKNKFGEGYCTFTLVIAWMRALQVDIQPVADRWHLMVQALNKLGIGDAADMRMEDRIMAPGGIAWQTQLVKPENVQIVTYPGKSDEQREEKLFHAHDSSMYPNLLRSLRRLSEFVRQAQADEIDGEAQGTDWNHIQSAIQGHRNKSQKMHNGRMVNDNRAASGYIGRLGRALGTACEALLVAPNR